jgi:hypothetical protein
MRERLNEWAQVGGVRSHAWKLHQLIPRFVSGLSSKGLEVDPAHYGFGDALDISVPVADPTRTDRLHRRGGQLHGRRRCVVDAPIHDKWVSERSRQVGPHRVQASEGGVLSADHVDHCVEHREGGLPLGPEVVLDTRGEHRVVRAQCVEGPQVLVEAQPPDDQPAGLRYLRWRDQLSRGETQLELWLLERAQGTDVDLDQLA